MADEDDEEREDEGPGAGAAAALAALIALIAGDVDEALGEQSVGDREQLLEVVALTAFARAFRDAGGTGAGAAAGTAFADAMRPAIALLSPDGTEAQRERLAQMLAHGAFNAATAAAAGAEAKFEWRTQRDERVRGTHVPMDGQVRAAGDTFDVAGHRLAYPGHPVGPPEIWMNCRCYLTTAGSVTAAAADDERPAGSTPELGQATPGTDAPKGTVVVARPADPTALAVAGGLPPDELHVTLGYYGDVDQLDPEIARLLEVFVTHNTLASDATVGGRGVIGNDDPPAVVLLLESPDLATLRATLEKVADPDRTHPHFTPHITLGYGIEMPTELPTSVRLDRLELWRGADRLGGDREMSAEMSPQMSPEMTAASDTPWGQFSASDYTISQWRRACILTMPGGDPESKSTYKLPIREPGGALNRNGVHAAASRFGSVQAPAAAKAAAKAKLRGAYRQIGEEAPDSLKADALLAWGPSTSPPGTHDAPGWITNPRETQRLRTYWTKGEGAAKIAWGSAGDLTRCAKHLAKYVLPEHVWGTCQNLHYEALGYWNPESAPQGSVSTPENDDAIAAVFAAASDLEDPMLPSRAFFEDPHLEGPTPQTIRASGDLIEYVGHLAAWGTCHTGFEGQCVQAPRTASGYAHFRLGEVETDDGFVPVGHITAGTGHAPTNLSAADTVAHYDNTGTVVADVAVGEDDHGIWAHGIVRPGITPEQLHALRAGTPSGDWRRLGGNLELVGALIVNVPGFPIPRPELAASAGRDLALVAAGVVTIDPNSFDAERVAIRVIERLDERERRVAAAARVAALRSQINGPRVEALAAAVGMPT